MRKDIRRRIAPIEQRDQIVRRRIAFVPLRTRAVRRLERKRHDVPCLAGTTIAVFTLPTRPLHYGAK